MDSDNSYLRSEDLEEISVEPPEGLNSWSALKNDGVRNGNFSLTFIFAS